MAAVATAATASTARYLNILEQAKRGVEQYEAKNVRRTEEHELPLEGELWSRYECELARHLPVRSDTGAHLVTDEAPGTEVRVHILEYDRRTGRTQFAAQQPVNGASGHILIDYKWLVRRVLEWLREHAASLHHVRQLKRPNNGSPVRYLRGLSQEQRTAVAAIVDEPLSYVWGPPGTGKTKCVLVNAIRSCLDRGKRVLVAAPTNLAVDNALQALLDSGVPEAHVARLGVPSKAFLSEHPDCCEGPAFQHEIRQLKSEIKTIESKLGDVDRRVALAAQIREYDIEVAAANDRLVELEAWATFLSDGLSECESQLLAAEEELRRLVLRENDARLKLKDVKVTSIEAEVQALKYERDRVHSMQQSGSGSLARAYLASLDQQLETKRRKLDMLRSEAQRLRDSATKTIADRRQCEQLVAVVRQRAKRLAAEREQSEAAIAAKQTELQSRKQLRQSACEALANLGGPAADEQLAQLRRELLREKEECENRLRSVSETLTSRAVLGMTLDGFVGLTLHAAVGVDHVVIDEAPYAPVAKILPLLSLGTPVAMLGDHKQLPPICECDDGDAVVRAYWAKPAIFLEDACQLGDQYDRLHALKTPRFRLTRTVTLRRSYRFGPSLADLLDRHVYESIGLTGTAGHDTIVECVNCEPSKEPGREPRQNMAEAEAMIECLKEWWAAAQSLPDPGTVALLTSYKNQLKLIRQLLKSRLAHTGIEDYVEVWNTHKAQGREWDWVLFSVSDTGRLEGNSPWFTDSARAQGREVLNTTISRARKRLTVFMDCAYWQSRRPPSLLTEIAAHFGTKPW